jgi:hypothetical protein
MVRRLFGPVLSKVGVVLPHGLDHWFRASADNMRGGFEPSNHPGDMTCILLPNRKVHIISLG